MRRRNTEYVPFAVIDPTIAKGRNLRLAEGIKGFKRTGRRERPVVGSYYIAESGDSVGKACECLAEFTQGTTREIVEPVFNEGSQR